MAMLQTTNLVLHPCSPDDAADFIDLERDPEVMHFLHGSAVDHENTDPDEVTFLMPRGHESYVWTARRKEDGEFVGWFCLSPEALGLAEAGYRLRRRYWGQGFATEGAAALLAWGFRVAGYDKVVACTSAVNQGSRRVMEKIGTTYSHTVSCDPGGPPGSALGEVWYEVTCAQWARN